MTSSQIQYIESPSGNGEGTAHPGVENSRINWIRRYEERGNPSDVCMFFGISRKTFYKWLKRYRESNGDPESLKDRSRRPHRIPRSTPASVVQLLRKARRETGFGQRRLKAYLKEKHAITLSERTIWKILRKEHEIRDLTQNG